MLSRTAVAPLALLVALLVCAPLTLAQGQKSGPFTKRAYQTQLLTEPAIHTELAGNALAQYPFFEYVRAFNEDAAIQVAIDPSLHPEIVGQYGEIYVVAAKTSNEWKNNPQLVDVRPGGPQTERFDPATIQDNTFQVAAPSTLSSQAGIGLGKGYDIVIDFNGDGRLNRGDFIDGYGQKAGFYVVHDTTQAGPLAVSVLNYSGGSWLDQRTWYPTALETLDPLPLVVISHGNGHNYTWYDYLQSHLASYGYVVMSHENNTGPGIESASTTTLTNTDYFLGKLDRIGGGIFEGHVDGTRITWIGHSRGGEGVCRAYDRLYDGAYTPVHFSLEDIRLISSIAPNDYLGRYDSNPHGVNYHLLHGAADGDNAGWPNAESDAPFHLFERAEGNRQVTYVHGADHGDFNAYSWNDFDGPAGTEIGRSEAQRVARATYLALLKHYMNGNIPAKDFLWRPYNRLRPMGVDPNTRVTLEYREKPTPATFTIDDFQSQNALSVSSSGGAVTYDVEHAYEGQMDDTDGTFTWNSGDPMNGMVRGRSNDLTRGLVFDWSTGSQRHLTFEMVAGARDFTAYGTLCFRACQGTRHPDTVAELADLDFSVSLHDQHGTSSRIRISAFGAGIQEPYQRTGSGQGAGWQNEFETIRIRLTDFLRNDSGLDLERIDTVRFDFGSANGSSFGRLAFDDLYLSGKP